MRTNTFVVYGFIGFDREVIYVGSTTNGMDLRVRQHALKPWWPEVAEVRFTMCETRQEMLDLESHHIRTRNPRHNINSGGSGLRAEVKRQPSYTIDDLLTDPNLARKAEIVGEMYS